MSSIEDRLLAEMRALAQKQTNEIMGFLRSMSVWNRQNAFDAIAVLNGKVARLEREIVALRGGASEEREPLQ
jgi:hypothetical protein